MHSKFKMKPPARLDSRHVFETEFVSFIKKLRKFGISTKNCVVVFRSDSDFYVSATGISAMEHDAAVEDFAKMVLASADHDREVARELLLKMYRHLDNEPSVPS